MAEPDDKAGGTGEEQAVEHLTEQEAGKVVGGMIGDTGRSITSPHVLSGTKVSTGLDNLGPVARPDPPTPPKLT